MAVESHRVGHRHDESAAVRTMCAPGDGIVSATQELLLAAARRARGLRVECVLCARRAIGRRRAGLRSRLN
eukprot:1924175-Prymnesium_polylepis.3